MSKIVGFKMGKGRTVRPGKGESWERRYLELEVTCPEKFTEESLQESFARAENILDFWLEQMGPQQAAAEIPELDLETIKSLPWKDKLKNPAKPGSWAWIFGPEADVGLEAGAEKLSAALEKAADHKLVLGDMEYSFSKNKAFINRAPVKRESAR